MVSNPITVEGKLPWGWHFHPTDAELIINLSAMLKMQRKDRMPFEPDEFPEQQFPEQLREIDLSKVEPWEISEQPETCAIRSAHSDSNSQFFYTQKGQKYRHGNRNNRATLKGFWKATGRDKPIYEPYIPRGGGVKRKVIGYRKALVFYSGRAPNGQKTDYILHECRLDNGSNAHDEQWVACHMFRKDRNDSKRQDPRMATLSPDLEEQQQEHHQPLLLQQHQHMHGPPIKEEAAYLPYTSGGPSYRQNSNASGLMNYPHMSSSSEGLDLPHLEEVHPVSPYQVPTANDGTQLRRVLGNLPSFNDGSMPPYPDSIFEPLAGYGDQFHMSGDNILWSDNV